MEALTRVGLDYTVACQVQLPFWHGRVDFYHIPSQTAMQVDGSSHFTGMHHRTSQQQLIMDIKCCAQAWASGVRLLRIDHTHAQMEHPMLTATQLLYPSFVMLTSKYEKVRMWIDGEQQPFVEWVASILPCTHRQVHPPNYILFR